MLPLTLHLGRRLMLLALGLGLAIPAYPAKPLRIVSAAPSITEILFELHLEKHLVGVTAACDFPAAAKQITSIGQFNQPNMEKLLSLSPTLLIAANASLEPALATLKQANIQVLDLKFGNFPELFSGILQIGQATGTEAAAHALVNRLQAELAAVAATYPAVPKQQRPKVFVELWHNPLTTAGGRTFVSEIIARAGGENVAQTLSQEYPQVNPEDVLDWNPDFILIARMVPGKQALEEIKHRIGWNQIRAVEQDQIITTISSDYLLRPGPRLVLGVKLLAQSLHPAQGNKNAKKK